MKFLNIQQEKKGAKNKLTSLSFRQLCVRAKLPVLKGATVNNFFYYET